jgi:type VI secretion system protein ImpI
MTLRLAIENMDRLPDGGPLRVEIKGRGLDIGRDSHLDWTLPDPSRHVSSKHCEIRFRDGGYWLHDVSTNGTFVNGGEFRLDAPYLLRNGDRLTIGPYIVSVAVEGQAAFGGRVAAGRPGAAPGAVAPADVWGGSGDVAAPDDRNAYMPSGQRQAGPDFLDFATGLAPPADAFEAAPFATPIAPDDDWLRVRPVAPIAPAPSPEAATPSPRRPPPPRAAPESPPPAALSIEAVYAAQAGDEAPAGPSDVLLRIARAAGIPERAFAARDANTLADEIGALLKLTAQNLAQLLSSRSETKSLMRSSSRTMIKALENNPLKFTATPEEALAIMLGPQTRNYLDAKATIASSFADLKEHQMQTFGAMQGALESLFEDLAPERIEQSVEPDRGLGALVGSRKAKMWDLYAERWRAKTKRSDGRLLEAFMALFAESYDRLQNKDR